MIQAKHYLYITFVLAVIASILVFLFTPVWYISSRGTIRHVFLLSMIPFLVAYPISLWCILRKKYQESKYLAEELARNDALWNLQSISRRIETTFFVLQKAIQEKRASDLEQYANNRLIAKLDKLLKQELNDSTDQVREDIVLNKHTIVSIEDYQDDSKDCLWAVVSYSMHTYAVDKQTGEQTTPQTLLKMKQRHKELWKFIRHPEKGWVLDDIDEKIQLSELVTLPTFSEEVADQHNEAPPLGKALNNYEWSLQKIQRIPEVPSINSPMLALAIGLFAPWLIVLLFFLRVVLGSNE